jgi:nitrite reductase (NADH) small subunit
MNTTPTPSGGIKPLETAFRIVDEAAPAKPRDGERVLVCNVPDLPPGSKKIITAGIKSIGVFNIAGVFHAMRNQCPHQGAPLCQGTVTNTYRPKGVNEYDPAFPKRIIRCPWHGWEFDIVTGKGLYDARGRVGVYPVEVDAEGHIWVTV